MYQIIPKRSSVTVSYTFTFDFNFADERLLYKNFWKSSQHNLCLKRLSSYSNAVLYIREFIFKWYPNTSIQQSSLTMLFNVISYCSSVNSISWLINFMELQEQISRKVNRGDYLGNGMHRADLKRFWKRTCLKSFRQSKLRKKFHGNATWRTFQANERWVVFKGQKV